MKRNAFCENGVRVSLPPANLKLNNSHLIIVLLDIGHLEFENRTLNQNIDLFNNEDSEIYRIHELIAWNEDKGENS